MDLKERKIIYSCASDIGLFRTENQDNFICNGIYMNHDSNTDRFSLAGTADLDGTVLFGVFDGMGGEECGEVAAFIAAKEAAGFKPAELTKRELKKYCFFANQKICEYAEEHEIYSMGTTAALLAFAGDKAILCNIGDSKIFRFDKKSLKQLSVDHLAPAPAGRKRPLSQNLGIPEDFMVIDPYVKQLTCRPEEVYILCSDGLTDMVRLEEMWKIASENDVTELASRLTEKALKNGGKDNVTVLAVAVTTNAQASRNAVQTYQKTK